MRRFVEYENYLHSYLLENEKGDWVKVRTIRRIRIYILGKVLFKLN